MLTAILLSAAATSLLAPAASAQDSNQAVVNQVQLGDVFSTQTLTVDNADNGAAAATVAIGNSATATGSGVALTYQGTQELNAEVHGKTNVSIGGSAGSALYETTSANGNTSTVGTCCATTSGSSVQTIDAYHGVTGRELRLRRRLHRHSVGGLRRRGQYAGVGAGERPGLLHHRPKPTTARRTLKPAFRSRTPTPAAIRPPLSPTT